MEGRADFSKGLAVAGAGFASFLGQGVVFREFLGVFEGGELSSGVFLFFWLLWICVGALFARLLGGELLSFAAKGFRPLSLLYVPALALQILLTSSARALAGVSPYEIFPFWKLLAASCLACAPLSLLTGFLFVVAASWLKEGGFSTARAYAWEAFGSCAGALASTLLLGFGLGSFQTAFCAGAALSAICLVSVLPGRSWPLYATFPLLFLASLGSGFALRLDSRGDEAAFKRVVPDGLFTGSFSTRQARYLTGEREGQFLALSFGSVLENVPGSYGSALRAMSLLSQAPKAKKVLVAGENSLNLSMALSELGETESVCLSSLDPEYPMALKKELPERFKEKLLKIRFSSLDPKSFLDAEKELDLVVINSVNMTSISSIRFMNKDFLKSVKASLSNDGVLVYFFPGAESQMGRELAELGSSISAELKEVFPDTLLAPGDPAALFAATRKGVLESDLEKLVDKAYKIAGVSERCEPERLRELFDKERAKWQAGKYAAVSTASGAGAMAPALACSAKRLGAPEGFWRLLAGSAAFAIVGLLFYLGYRTLWRLDLGPKRKADARTKRRNAKLLSLPASPFDSKALALLSAFFASAAFVALLARYQTAYGSLAVDFGLLNALFMGGSFLFAWLSLKLHEAAAKTQGAAYVLLPLACFFLAALACASKAPDFLIPLQAFGAGAFCGALAAFASIQLAAACRDETKAALSLQACDCLGGAFGSLLAALLFIPFTGPGFRGVFVLLLPLSCLPFLLSKGAAFKERREGWPFKLLGASFFLVWLLSTLAFVYREPLDLHGWRLKLTLLALLGAALFPKILYGSLKMDFAAEGLSLKARLMRSKPLWLGAAFACLALALLLAFGSGRLFAREPLRAASGASEALSLEDPKGAPRKADASKIQSLMEKGRLSSKEASFWISAEGR